MIPRGASELALDAICQGEDETIKLQLCFQMHIIWIHSIYGKCLQVENIFSVD